MSHTRFVYTLIKIIVKDQHDQVYAERFNSDYIDGMIVRGKRGDYRK